VGLDVGEVGHVGRKALVELCYGAKVCKIIGKAPILAQLLLFITCTLAMSLDRSVMPRPGVIY
jgi:hypothetical protein